MHTKTDIQSEKLSSHLDLHEDFAYITCERVRVWREEIGENKNLPHRLLPGTGIDVTDSQEHPRLLILQARAQSNSLILVMPLLLQKVS